MSHEPRVDAQGRLGPDSRPAEPSPVPGLTQAEFDDIAADILWWSSRPVGERLRAAGRHARDERLLRRLARSNRAP